jgi:hypothetical protein
MRTISLLWFFTTMLKKEKRSLIFFKQLPYNQFKDLCFKP